MARIISSRKKYVPVKDLVVYPSKTETIEVIPDDGFNGAHRYRARITSPVGKWWVVAVPDGGLYVTDGDEPIVTGGSSWSGNDNKFLWTSAIDDVFKDCFIPTTTYEKGPLQFEIDEQLNTTWYKK